MTQTSSPVTGDELTITPIDGRHGVSVRGDVDIATVPALQSALDGLVAGSGDVHVDLGGLRFVDLSGAGALVAAAARLGPDRVLVLHEAPHSLRRILDRFWDGVARIRVDVR